MKKQLHQNLALLTLMLGGCGEIPLAMKKGFLLTHNDSAKQAGNGQARISVRATEDQSKLNSSFCADVGSVEGKNSNLVSL